MTASNRLRTAAKWMFRLAASAVVLVVVVVGAVYGVSGARMASTYDVPVHALRVTNDSAMIERGRHVATIKGCVECHNAGLTGNMLLNDPAVGRLAGPNLTMGGRGAELTDADWERAVRHGVRRDGTPMVFMPSDEFTTLSDEDLAAIVAYARALEPSNKVMLPSKAGPIIRALHLAGQVTLSAEEITHADAHPVSVKAEPTAEFGKYLAAGCTGCHGDGFSGGPIPGAPPEFKAAANITPAGIGSYSEEDFRRVMRTGMRPSGVPVDPSMPWKLLREMTDTEISAIYKYLRTVPARQYGLR